VIRAIPALLAASDLPVQLDLPEPPEKTVQRALLVKMVLA
jgi:hypothetical protein